MVDSSPGGSASRDDGGFGACERDFGWVLYMKGDVVSGGFVWYGFLRVFVVD